MEHMNLDIGYDIQHGNDYRLQRLQYKVTARKKEVEMQMKKSEFRKYGKTG